jgi:hypothetical protein
VVLVPFLAAASDVESHLLGAAPRVNAEAAHRQGPLGETLLSPLLIPAERLDRSVVRGLWPPHRAGPERSDAVGHRRGRLDSSSSSRPTRRCGWACDHHRREPTGCRPPRVGGHDGPAAIPRLRASACFDRLVAPPTQQCGDAARAPARLRAVDWPPTRNSQPADPASTTTSRSQHVSTGTTRAAGSPTRTSRALSPTVTSRAATRATQRPSSPAPAPSANRARAARSRPGVGCANAAARNPSSSRAVYGKATCRRATGAGLASHGALAVNSGPTLRRTDR